MAAAWQIPNPLTAFIINKLLVEQDYFVLRKQSDVLEIKKSRQSNNNIVLKTFVGNKCSTFCKQFFFKVVRAQNWFYMVADRYTFSLLKNCKKAAKQNAKYLIFFPKLN